MLGAERLVHGQLGGQAFTLRMDAALPPPSAGRVAMTARAEDLHWFDTGTGARLA